MHSVADLRSLAACALLCLTLCAVARPARAQEIASGQSHTCAITSGGGVRCWGSNGSNQLGDGTTTNRSTPVDVTGLQSGVTAISAGAGHTCALTSGGGVKCWGDGGNGRLGDGFTTNRLIPVDVTDLTSGVIAIGAGQFHTCAVTATGGAKCWGANNFGQLGDNSTTERLTPVDVTNLTSGVSAIDGGTNFTCAIASGGAKCWGNNSQGNLGDGTTADRLTPVDVTNLTSGVTAIVAGGTHACAIASGGAKCWGNGSNGRLGNNSTTMQLTPVDVTSLTSGVSAISTAGGSHTCAIDSGGGAKCWGNGANGRLGDGTTTLRLTPVNVTDLTSGVSAITASAASHTCAITAGGVVKCWGSNGSNQLGDGTTTQRLTPVDVAGTFLPVELVAFTATADGPAARLTWTTASETNNAGFSVETLRGAAWQDVAFVAGRGTTSETHTYTRTVAGLAPGRHAFRLRQLDVDGTATLSGTVEVVIAGDGRIRIYPSPSRTSVRIDGLTMAADVVDALGRVVARAVPGEALSVGAWAPGVYVVMAAAPQRFVVAQ